jgi:AbiJ N-terminal domain 5
MLVANNNKILSIKETIAEKFSEENWLELGLLTGQLDVVKNHPRLLRSLNWRDSDYNGHALSVLTHIIQNNPGNLEIIEKYLHQHFGDEGTNVSSAESVGRRIYFTPSVFQAPTSDVENDLISLMMPFDAAFASVQASIVEAALRNQMRCQRADDIWINSVIAQDIFSLIYRSKIVVCDFTGRNPNVFYEAGIAHTLGKHVIPITQYPGDIPFDLQAHRYLQYHNNMEGLTKLADEISRRIQTLSPRPNSWPEVATGWTPSNWS